MLFRSGTLIPSAQHFVWAAKQPLGSLYGVLWVRAEEKVIRQDLDRQTLPSSAAGDAGFTESCRVGHVLSS